MKQEVTHIHTQAQKSSLSNFEEYVSTNWVLTPSQPCWSYDRDPLEDVHDDDDEEELVT